MFVWDPSLWSVKSVALNEIQAVGCLSARLIMAGRVPETSFEGLEKELVHSEARNVCFGSCQAPSVGLCEVLEVFAGEGLPFTRLLTHVDSYEKLLCACF